MKLVKSPFQLGRKVRTFDPVTNTKTKVIPVGVPELKSADRFKLPVLVTGAGRSGTTWFSRTLQAAGLDAPHECCGQHGTVSWYFWADNDWYPYQVWRKPEGRCVHVGERRSDFEFHSLIHMVRDPLKVIASTRAVMLTSDYAYAEATGAIPPDLQAPTRKELKLLRTAHMVYNICIEVENQHPDLRLPLEQAPRKWSQVMKLFGWDPKTPMPELPPAHRGTGYRTPQLTSYPEIEKLDYKLSRSLRRMAKKFGYL